MVTDVLSQISVFCNLLRLFLWFSMCHNLVECMLLNNVILVKMVKDVLYLYWGFPGSTSGKESACQCRRCQSCEFYPCVRKNPWRRAQQLTPVIFAWRIPWTEEPGGLQSIGSQRVRHNWSDLACMYTHTFTDILSHCLLNNWKRCIKISKYVYLFISSVCICWFLLYLN